MTDKRDGGPAFPRVGEGFGDDRYDTPGMSLRDYFAAAALNSGLIKVEGCYDYELIALFGKDRTGITRAEIAAAKAYEIADEMISRRSE